MSVRGGWRRRRRRGGGQTFVEKRVEKDALALRL